MADDSSADADVVELDAYRPHVVIDTQGFGGDVHVYPVRYWIDYAAGIETVDAPTPEVLRQIVVEWLRCQLEHGGHEAIDPAP